MSLPMPVTTADTNRRREDRMWLYWLFLSIEASFAVLLLDSLALIMFHLFLSEVGTQSQSHHIALYLTGHTFTSAITVLGGVLSAAHRQDKCVKMWRIIYHGCHLFMVLSVGFNMDFRIKLEDPIQVEDASLLHVVTSVASWGLNVGLMLFAFKIKLFRYPLYVMDTIYSNATISAPAPAPAERDSESGTGLVVVNHIWDSIKWCSTAMFTRRRANIHTEAETSSTFEMHRRHRYCNFPIWFSATPTQAADFDDERKELLEDDELEYHDIM